MASDLSCALGDGRIGRGDSLQLANSLRSKSDVEVNKKSTFFRLSPSSLLEFLRARHPHIAAVCVRTEVYAQSLALFLLWVCCM